MRKKQKGFTLIELLVVISIIGLLASIVLVSLNNARSKARDTRRIADLRQLVTALNLYYQDNNSYPTCDQQAYPNACNWSTWQLWPTMMGANQSKYISKIPVDPQNVDLGNCDSVANCHIYRYCSANSGQNFTLAVNLENAPIASSSPTINWCLTGGPNNYYIGQ